MWKISITKSFQDLHAAEYILHKIFEFPVCRQGVAVTGDLNSQGLDGFWSMGQVYIGAGSSRFHVSLSCYFFLCFRDSTTISGPFNIR
jgi:hypothetical protein